MKADRAFEAVVFDLFGTLIENLSHSGYRDVLTRMAIELDACPDDFIKAWSSTINLRMTGQFGSMENNVRCVCEKIGVSTTDAQLSAAAEIRLGYTRQCFVPRDDAISTLQTLKGLGFKTGLVTDCTAEVPFLWPHTLFLPLFDATVFSCLIGTTKPDPIMYQTISERLGVEPDKCIYIGDGSSQELTGARQIGMRALLITGPQLDLANVDRSDFAQWDGEKISALSEVLTII